MDQQLQSIMRDPTTSNCRIYVGNIHESVTTPDLTTHFSKYGQIRGVLINRGFGFIQFDNETGANRAIQSENNKQFQGRKLSVKNAVKNPSSGNAAAGSSGNASGGGVGDQQQQQQQHNKSNEIESALPQDLNRSARPSWKNRGGRGGGRGGRGGGGGGGGGNNEMQDKDDRDRSPLGGNQLDQDQRWGHKNQNNFNNFGNGNNVGGNGNIGGGNGGGGGMGGSNMNMGPGNNFSMNSNQMHGQQQQQQQQQQQHQITGNQQSFDNNDRNDCEIIVMRKALTQYAEAIEARLKRVGLAVDLLFPNEDVPIGKVMANIASRGCMYAILVLPQNEEHRSITVSILNSAQPTEHRNMPVEDALDMIFTDFQENMQNRNSNMSTGPTQPTPNMPTAVEITPTSSYAAPPLNTRHPEAIQTLVNLLADNRPITVLQYDRVIKYLQERREFQLKAEIGDAPPDMAIPLPVDPEAELQKKILDILNKPSIMSTSVGMPTIPPVSSSLLVNKIGKINTTTTSTSKPGSSNSSSGGGSQPQLLNDPKVQKALDSLLSGSLFNI